MTASLCLLAGGLVVALGADRVELRWTHSVEKIEWAETWEGTGTGLALIEARIRGSGAGMEIPDGAVLSDGAWVYRPDVAPIAKLSLRRSGATDDWRICVKAGCRSMGELIPGAADPVDLAPCPAG
jgi:hypothetical protein